MVGLFRSTIRSRSHRDRDGLNERVWLDLNCERERDDGHKVCFCRRKQGERLKSSIIIYNSGEELNFFFFFSEMIFHF